MTDKSTQIADALQRLKAATDRHKAAVKTLEDFDNILGRVAASRTNPNPIPVTSWGIAVDYDDMRYEGGIKVGGYGKPIMPWQWLSGEKIVETIKEKNASAAERDEARELLVELGFDIQQLAS
ncbi:MAG: hypothetical protein F4X11_08025 [Acidobacteria bacterium]|nr:hypothetical protein [Acidobacteriota bacterium]